MRLQRGFSDNPLTKDGRQHKLEERRIRETVKHNDKVLDGISGDQSAQMELLIAQAELSNVIAGISVAKDPELKALLERRAEQDLWNLVS